MEENIQAEALQDEIEEKKVYSSFENYTKKQVTLIGYLLGIKEFHITNPPFDQAYLQKIKGTKEIEIILIHLYFLFIFPLLSSYLLYKTTYIFTIKLKETAI